MADAIITVSIRAGDNETVGELVSIWAECAASTWLGNNEMEDMLEAVEQILKSHYRKMDGLCEPEIKYKKGGASPETP